MLLRILTAKQSFKIQSLIHMEISENGFIFSDKKALLVIDDIHHYLSVESYWAKGIPLDTVKRSIENSLCFGIYKDQEQDRKSVV